MAGKVGFVSLGCPKNKVDSEVVLGELVSRGYDLTQDKAAAEYLIINTCGFKDSAKAESVDTIMEMACYKETGNLKKLIVMGCLTQRYKDELLIEIPEIDHIVGAGDFKSVVQIFQAQSQKRNLVKPPAFTYSESAERILTTPRHSAYLKISEGCSNTCSFCIIPSIRGPFKSIPLKKVVEEAHRLVEAGVREINLVSQDTTMYGADLGYKKKGLSALLRELEAIPKLVWIRLLYCYPTFINQALLDQIGESEKTCPYIDLPLHHSHDTLLKSMLREEREEDIRQILSQLRKTVPGVAVRTAFIVGFPGETAEHFNSLKNFVEEMRFEHLGVFTYSREEGTVSATLDGQIPETLKAERREEIMKIQEKISSERLKGFVGKKQRVLVDGFSEEEYLMVARTAWQAPETDGVVYIDESDVREGEFVDVTISQSLEHDLVGRVVSEG
ncbi:MAG: 30S ribosomal protein S12 methylthiotransferase RimO [Nitrospinota bacterium]